MDVPIGSIIAFAGEVAAGRGFEATNPGWMICDGRTLDGTDPKFKPLLEVLLLAWGGNEGTHFFNIPNLQGFFLRGVEPREVVDAGNPDLAMDADGDLREFISPGQPFKGNVGRRVGSIQNWATGDPGFTDQDPRHPRPTTSGAFPSGRLPANPFTTIPAAPHRHGLNFEINATRDVDDQSNTVAYPGPQFREAYTDSVDNPRRTIEGGNRETRPRNAYVYWVIRVY